MNTILVPGPPKAAFNKHRRISDLIKAQVEHLKHLEHKMPEAVRAKLPQHAIVTENDAALYIASMTELFRSQEEKPGSVIPPSVTPPAASTSSTAKKAVPKKKKRKASQKPKKASSRGTKKAPAKTRGAK